MPESVKSGFVRSIWICREDFVGVNHPETAGVFQDVFADGGCVASVPDP